MILVLVCSNSERPCSIFFSVAAIMVHVDLKYRIKKLSGKSGLEIATNKGAFSKLRLDVFVNFKPCKSAAFF